MADYKPADIYIGVIDLFAVLLPGALVTYCYADLAQQYVFGTILPRVPGDWRGVLVFAFVSYVVGHFVFFFGAQIDEKFGDRSRARKLRPKDKALLARVVLKRWDELTPQFMVTPDVIGKIEEALSRRLVASASRLPMHVPFERDVLVAKVNRIHGGEWSAHEQAFLELAEVETVNSFQWATAMLDLQAAGAAAQVERLEADSKFFRSLIIVMMLIAPVIGLNAWFGPWDAATTTAAVLRLTVALGALAGIAWMSFRRYIEQRQKAINRAYTYFLGLPLRSAESTKEGAFNMTWRALSDRPREE